MKDSATQVLIKYKSGALVTQKVKFHIIALDKDMWPIYLKNGNTLQKNSLVFSLKMKKLNETGWIICNAGLFAAVDSQTVKSTSVKSTSMYWNLKEKVNN